MTPLILNPAGSVQMFEAGRFARQIQGKFRCHHRSMKNILLLDNYYCPEEQMFVSALSDDMQRCGVMGNLESKCKGKYIKRDLQVLAPTQITLLLEPPFK